MTSAASTGDASSFHAAAWAAGQQVHRLFQWLDDGRFADVAAMFAADGVWLRQGSELVGPSGVLQALQSRPAALATRHLVSNLVADGDAAVQRLRYYVTAFADETAGDGPGRLAAPQSIFVCDDRLVHSAGGGWRFARRAPRLVFKGG